MTTWKKALLIAGVFELPLVFMVLANGKAMGLLGWYHFLSLLAAGFVWILFFGHGGPSGTWELPYTLVFCVVYPIQVLLTTPILFLILKFVERLRSWRLAVRDKPPE